MDTQEKTKYLEVLKHIRSELNAATNPSLIPHKLHELRNRLHTLIEDTENELASAINDANSDAEASDAEAQQPESESEPETKGKLFDKPKKKK